MIPTILLVLAVVFTALHAFNTERIPLWPAVLCLIALVAVGR